MDRRRVLVNAASSLVQVIVISAVLFVQYKYLLGIVGASGLGIWSLVLATTAVTQIANLGLSGSVVKFVARYLARNEPEAVVRLLQTAVTAVGVLMAVALALAYPLVRLILRLVVSADSLPAVLSLLPYALVAFWLLVVAGIFQAGFDGLQRLDIRSGLLMAAALLHLALCFILVPRFGLVGLGYARIIQNAVTFIAGLVLLRRMLPGLPFFPRRWDKRLFREMFGYGVNFQAISLLNMLYDPVTKGLLSRFGGLSLVGFYEMASRMVQQARSLLVGANQALIPFIAHIQETAPEKLKAVYRTSYDLMFYLSLPVFTGLAVGAPFISRLWIGTDERAFVASAVMLSAACWVNALAVPAYFSNFGTGELRPNLAGHLVIAVVNVVGGSLLGLGLGGYGVITGWAIALAAGSAVIFLSAARRQGLPLGHLWPRPSRILTGACLASVGAAVVLRLTSRPRPASLGFEAAVVVPLAVLIAGTVWFHPLRPRLLSWIRVDLLGLGPRAEG